MFLGSKRFLFFLEWEFEKANFMRIAEYLPLECVAAEPPPRQVRVALAGNPNSGKTTIFNNLTGAQQHVGNYAGVTVEQKSGTCHITASG